MGELGASDYAEIVVIELREDIIDALDPENLNLSEQEYVLETLFDFCARELRLTRQEIDEEDEAAWEEFDYVYEAVVVGTVAAGRGRPVGEEEIYGAVGEVHNKWIIPFMTDRGMLKLIKRGEVFVTFDKEADDVKFIHKDGLEKLPSQDKE